MFTEKLLAVVVLVGAFAILVRLLLKVNRNSLEIEIMRRQKDLEKPVFDDIDFEKYSSIKELLQLNEELKNLQRIKKAKDGSLPWYEGLTPVSEKITHQPFL